MHPPTRARAAAVTALLALLLAVTGCGHNKTHAPAKVTAPAATSGPTGPAGELDSTPKEIKQLQDPVPDDIPKPVIERANQRADRLADQADLPAKPQPIPGGAQGYSCRTRINSRGYGAFRTQVHEFVEHYTVSHNIPGWGDVYAIANYLNGVGLGATYVIDFEGHCLQINPVNRNPYTQGWFNQYAESVEIIAYGNETTAQWMASPLIKNGILASLTRDRLKARKLPLRFVDPVGCNAPLGWTDHLHLECGNDHHDVGPNFPYAFFARQVALTPRVAITKSDRKRCRQIAAYRARRRHGLKPTNKGTRQFSAKLKTTHSRRLKCVNGKVRRLR